MLSDADRRVTRAAIVGVAGLDLQDSERRLFSEKPPLGFILFARNCEAPDQVKRLLRDLRAAVGDRDAPVFIDQEGGRVTRLKPPTWRGITALRAIGTLADKDLESAKEVARLHARLIAGDLLPLGITVNCAPVLDLGLPAQTEAIGDRAFSADPELVAVLGSAMIDGYLESGVLPVIKHLPGHGRALIDSHLDLPRVDASLDELREADWLPFKACAGAPFGMTAHILFSALDAKAPATLSKTIIGEVVRGEIGFGGALLSDDLSMKALGGSLYDRAALAIEAGCDLALHCNGDFDEMSQVLAAAGPLEGKARKRVDQALARKAEPAPFDRDGSRQHLEALLPDGEHRAGGIA